METPAIRAPGEPRPGDGRWQDLHPIVAESGCPGCLRVNGGRRTMRVRTDQGAPMIRQTLLSLCVAALGAAALPTSAQTTESGGMLRDAQGKTLYIFDKDTAGVSACYDGC